MISENMALSALKFKKVFSSNESCAKHLAEQRWPDGFICPQCKHHQAWFLSKRNLYECKDCRHQTSVTAGTLFHNSHVSLRNWYMLIFCMSVLEEGVVISEMQRLLNIGCYKTAWLMAHKIRKAMSARDERFKLAGLAKINLSYFRSKAANLDQGRKRNKVVLFAVALYRNYQGEKEPGFAQMKIVNDASKNTIKNFLEKIDRRNKSAEGNKLLTKISKDGWKAYPPDDDTDNLSHCEIALLNNEPEKEIIPWIFDIIADAREAILETHRGVSNKYLHAYISEIVYRFNNRNWEQELFDRLIQACLKVDIVTYKNLVHPIKTSS